MYRHDAPKKVREYMAMLRTKKMRELADMFNNLIKLSKEEAAKHQPDKAMLRNYHWQRNMIKAERDRRRNMAVQKDRLEQVKDNTAKPLGKPFSEMLKERSLEELNKMLAETEKSLANLDKPSEGRPNIEAIKALRNELLARIEAIKAEIATRDKKAADEAKKDMQKAEGKMFGIDKEYVNMGAIGLAIGGIMGSAIGGWKNVVGYAILGAGIGGGITYLMKQGEAKREAQVV